MMNLKNTMPQSSHMNSEITNSDPVSGDKELRWIQITATLVGLIGLVALFALMTQGAHAATGTTPAGNTVAASSGGFNPGNRPSFPSPFGNQPGANAAPAAMDEADDEEPTAAMPSGATPSFNRGAGNPVMPIAGQPNRFSGAGANQAGAGTVALDGAANANGLISSNKVGSIPLDSETGEGGRNVVENFNYPDADIMEIAKTLGKLTGKNFIFDKDVKGRISIISNSPITVSDAWKAFLTALDMNGFSLIPSGKYIRIARQRDARDKQLKTYTGDYSPDTDALITRVFPLKYIDAEEVARTFRSFVPANSRIIPYEQTNTVIVTDTGSNIAKLNKMLELLDVEGYDAGIEVIPVKYASALELSKLIDTLIPGTGGAPSPGGAAPRPGGFGSSKFNARRTKEGGIINTIIADERSNTLIVHANTKGAQQVRDLVLRLDQKTPSQVGGGKVHVVYLQFADSTEIATTLNSLSQNATGGVNRPISPVNGGGGVGVNPVTQNIFEGSVKVSPDKSTNSLVINASPADFGTVARVISRLDIPRDQVYVEVIVMEIALNKNFNFSANVANPVNGLGSLPNGTDLSNFLTNPLSSSGAVLGFKSGNAATYTIGGTTVSVPNLTALITAIQSNSKSNVLATPQIIALDNTEATFDQTENIPILTNTAVQGAGVSSSISKQPVPLSIKIKPQINKYSNYVKLDVTAKISNIENRQLPSAVSNQAYATLERSATSSVFVADGDTVVMGGLIRDQVDDTVSKIPLLGDIPILGWLFSSRTNTVTKSNLVIFLTPRIVRQYSKIRAILDRKLEERDEFVESQMGGQDPMRAQRDNMIRGLPDIKVIEAQKPQSTVSLDDDQPAAKYVDPNQPAPKGATPPGDGAPPSGSMPSAPLAPPPPASANGADATPADATRGLASDNG